MSKTRYYIISGIPRGHSGVGRVISYLEDNNKGNYEVKTLMPSVKNELSQIQNPFQFFGEAVYRKIVKRVCNYLIRIKLSRMRGKIIVLIHPQTLGFSLSEKLMNNNFVFYYPMDNSFFCLRSYNFCLENDKSGPCLRCLGGYSENAKKFNCYPGPVHYSRERNIRFLKYLQDAVFRKRSSLRFICQNEFQKKLIQDHFHISATTIGLHCADFEDESELIQVRERSGFDFVFHGAPVLAKGLKLFFTLASRMSDYSFLLPASKEQVLKRYPQFSNFTALRNIKFQKMTWETGLKHELQNAHVILNLSLWSAPIEGALIKSLQNNGVVATSGVQTSFAGEIPDNITQKLDMSSISNSVDILIRLREDTNKRILLCDRSVSWVKKFLNREFIDVLDSTVLQEEPRTSPSIPIERK